MFKRGFKSYCENLAIYYRKEFNVSSDKPIDINLLVEYLNITLLNPNDIKGIAKETLSTLIVSEAAYWSAVTLSNEDEFIVIYNSAHSLARQSNDIMHEASHIILDHKPQTLHSYETGIFLRHYDEAQEDEANWLAATMLLPKAALFNIKKNKLSNKAAADIYGVSEQLVKMRLNTSGVNIIYKNMKKKI